MSSRLTSRSDTPTVSTTDRVSDRVAATQTTCRIKAAKSVRSDHKPIRIAPRPAKAIGATMSYQQGFTSGPGV
ncbi:hypothetical protein [Hasllibacter sp. MH4015]|uniref:hypothetical protein n=1 Tax=Hasllibacter sp. MH4015 TaxID=2854029 RepID=UPI001CD64D3F|nr:hypothetical protein [Hasllibacter sp. MH4015]